jgi:hypothetical protein
VIDVACLSKLTAIARYEVGNPLFVAYVDQVRALARRRRISLKDAVIAWLRGLPQTDDNGRESVRVIACEPDQRARLFPDDPNCFERALAALILLELLDPSWQYTLASVDDPLRHTGILQRPDDSYPWEPIDLFPSSNSDDGGWLGWLREVPRAASTRPTRRARRRTRDANATVQRIFGIVHPIGAGVLDAFGEHGAANFLGDQERHFGLLKQELRRPVVPGMAAQPLPVEQTAPAGPHLPVPALTAPSLSRTSPASATPTHSPQGDMTNGNYDESEKNAPTWTPSGTGSTGAARQATAQAPQRRRYFW